MADHLRQAAGRCYGTACRAFLERITARLDDLPQAVRMSMGKFVQAYCPEEADGQVKRAANRFGLVAAAGELAVSMGVLPWPQDEATRAAAACFHAWLEQRGGTGALELSRGVAQVQRFFQAHGESRFSLVSDKVSGPTTKDRAGFRRQSGPDGDEGWEYLVFPEVFKQEVCAGYDSKALARELARLGLLVPGGDGKTSCVVKLPNLRKARYYRFSAEVLGQEGGLA